MSRRIKMLRQVNERLFLYFEVPRWNGTSRSNLCNAQKLVDDVRAYFADEELWYTWYSARCKVHSARCKYFARATLLLPMRTCSVAHFSDLSESVFACVLGWVSNRECF